MRVGPINYCLLRIYAGACDSTAKVRLSLAILFWLGFCLGAFAQDEEITSTNSAIVPVLRTNPDDIRLATLASDVDTSNASGDSTSDQWKSLATQPKDPMVAPTPLQASTNSMGGVLADSKPRPRKDDYGPQTGWGIRTAVGPAIQQSISLGALNGIIHANVFFQPGFRWDFEPYYNLVNGFSFGLESGFIYNSISSYSLTYPDGFTSGKVYGSSEAGSGSYYQVPILMNIRFQIPNNGRFRSYLPVE